METNSFETSSLERGLDTGPCREILRVAAIFAIENRSTGGEGISSLEGDEGKLGVMDSVRVDKWMWAVRLFKTRGLAAKACESGRVRTGERVFKASSELKGGELLELPFPEGPGTRVVRVLGLIDKRVGASEARAACEEITPPEVIGQRKIWSESRAQRLIGEQGRPTKKNRRAMEEKRGFFE
jgi:ribosome-associated heat shock protein Hsp15